MDVRGRVDIVVHWASPAAPLDYTGDVGAGSHGTQNMLNLQRLQSRMCPDDGQVVSSFITQAVNGDPLDFYGDSRPDMQLLLRRRSHPWDRRHDRLQRTGTSEPGQSCEYTVAELADGH